MGVSGDHRDNLEALRTRKGWDLELYHADADAQRQLGVLKKEKGLHGTPLSFPVAVVCDPGGIVRFIEVRDALFARTGPQALLAALDGLKA